MRKHGGVARKRKRLVEQVIATTSRCLHYGITSRKIRAFLEDFREEHAFLIRNGP